MFKNDFQGGTHFEIFSAQGKDPTAHWKLTGNSGIKKEFDKSVKSYVYVLDGSAATTKMQLPKDPRHNLALVQRFLVMQLFVPKGADLSVDLGIQDLTGSKRRLHFSTAIRETSTTPLHSKVPLSLINRDLWCNLCIDLSNFVAETWQGQAFKSIDAVCLSASCRLRRIFTLRTQPPDTTNDEELYGLTGTNTGEIEGIPRQCTLAPDIPQATQVLTFVKILHYEGKRRPPPEIILDTSSSGGVLDISASSGSSRYHIAFGTKMPGNAQKKSATREGGNTCRSSKSNSARNKSDSTTDLTQNRQSSAPMPGGSKRLRSIQARDRMNSDPGYNQEDLDTSVDKEPRQPGQTWMDGTDDGKSNMAFVNPHPPREPSADRIHRKPRVKSGSKERSAARISVSNNEDHSSSFFASGSQKNFSASEGLHQPTVVANVEELQNIMSNMRESTRRGMHKSQTGSEVDSHNTSCGVDDSLDEVINTLRTTSLTEAREYEDTDNDDEDEDEEEEEEEQVFLFSSKPKTAPRHKKTRKLVPRVVRPRPAPGPDQTQHKGRATSAESDFVCAGSSEEEESIMTRVLRHHSSPRVSPVTSANKSGRGPRQAAPPHQPTMAESSHAPVPASTSVSAPDLAPTPTAAQSAQSEPAQRRLNGQGGRAERAGRRQDVPGDYPGVRSSLRSPHGQICADKSPMGSQSRMSIRKKSLREIPKDDVRLSQQSKPYSPDKYTMDELSESYEAAMLQSLRRQTLEEGVAESEEEKSQQPHHQSHLHYSDHSLEDSDSDSDTDRSTLKTRNAAKQKEHNYQDEMKSDFLNQSNPRDWGNIFSPPIVFPSQKSSALLTPSTLQVPTQNSAYGSRNHVAGIREQGDTDEEDELDLLYDPVLNCYFDPKTCKYYELV